MSLHITARIPRSLPSIQCIYRRQANSSAAALGIPPAIHHSTHTLTSTSSQLPPTRAKTTLHPPPKRPIRRPPTPARLRRPKNRNEDGQRAAQTHIEPPTEGREQTQGGGGSRQSRPRQRPGSAAGPAVEGRGRVRAARPESGGDAEVEEAAPERSGRLRYPGY